MGCSLGASGIPPGTAVLDLENPPLLFTQEERCPDVRRINGPRAKAALSLDDSLRGVSLPQEVFETGDVAANRGPVPIGLVQRRLALEMAGEIEPVQPAESGDRLRLEHDDSQIGEQVIGANQPEISRNLPPLPEYGPELEISCPIHLELPDVQHRTAPFPTQKLQDPGHTTRFGAARIARPIDYLQPSIHNARVTDPSDPSGSPRGQQNLTGTGEARATTPAGRIVDRLDPNRLIRETPILDQLTDQLDRTRRLLAGDAEEAAEAALARFGDDASMEARIAVELAVTDSLASPERFPEAHRIVIRALEVLDREGSRNPRVPNLGPLSVVVEFVVEYVARYIVKSYAQDVANTMKRIYTRREAQAPPRDPSRYLLARSRADMDRIAPGYGGGGFGPLAFVFGGILVPVLASAGKSLGAVPFTKPLIIGGLALLFVLSLALSSIVLQGASIAHRRSRLIMQQPLAALWETIGHVGDPPEDDAVQLATFAVIFTALLWFVVPAGIAVLYFLL